MSELTLTLLRLGLLLALWLFVFGVLSTLRRDLLGDSRTSRARTVRQPRTQTRAPRRRGKGAHLVITRADGTTQRLELGDAALTFGRADDNTIVFPDDYTSTHHARISRRERHWVVEDCGSTNGTWVDRRRITSPMPLTPGMRVRIGKAEIVVHT